MRGALLLLTAFLLCSGCDEVERWLEEDARERTGEPAFYQYTDDNGRTVFVNHPSMAPAGAQARPVDVSHVPLNTELGNDWNRAIADEHSRLVESEQCETVRDEAARPFHEQALDDYGHLLAFAALFLLLLVTAPAMMRRVDPPRWARFLAFVLPMVAVLALLTHVVVQTTRVRDRLKDNAAVCSPDWLRNSPLDPRARLQALERLEAALKE